MRPSDAVGGEDEGVVRRDRQNRGGESRQAVADDAAAQEERLMGTAVGPESPERSLHVAHTEPSDGFLARREPRQAHHDAPRADERLMAAAGERRDGLTNMRFKSRDGPGGGVRGLEPVAKAVDDRDEHPTRVRGDHIRVPGLCLAVHRAARHTPLETPGRHRFHFFAVTTVPWPIPDSMSNSSIRRLTPGSPRPRLPDVENPSSSA